MATPSRASYDTSTFDGSSRPCQAALFRTILEVHSTDIIDAGTYEPDDMSYRSIRPLSVANRRQPGLVTVIPTAANSQNTCARLPMNI